MIETDIQISNLRASLKGDVIGPDDSRYDELRRVFFTIAWRFRGREQLPHATITKLLVTHDGRLWIGTFAGLASLKDGRLVTYQTIWFRAAGVGVTLVPFGLFQLRLRQIARDFNLRLDERVSKRTRIARELHDTLLQSFQGWMLRFQSARELLPARPAEAVVRGRSDGLFA
jgi:signal transduction histidine kinase